MIKQTWKSTLKQKKMSVNFLSKYLFTSILRNSIPSKNFPFQIFSLSRTRINRKFLCLKESFCQNVTLAPLTIFRFFSSNAKLLIDSILEKKRFWDEKNIKYIFITCFRVPFFSVPFQAYIYQIDFHCAFMLFNVWKSSIRTNWKYSRSQEIESNRAVTFSLKINTILIDDKRILMVKGWNSFCTCFWYCWL